MVPPFFCELTGFEKRSSKTKQQMGTAKGVGPLHHIE